LPLWANHAFLTLYYCFQVSYIFLLHCSKHHDIPKCCYQKDLTLYIVNTSDSAEMRSSHFYRTCIDWILVCLHTYVHSYIFVEFIW